MKPDLTRDSPIFALYELGAIYELGTLLGRRCMHTRFLLPCYNSTYYLSTIFRNLDDSLPNLILHFCEKRYRSSYYGIYALGNIFRITHYLGISPTTSVAGTKTWAQCKQSDVDAARHVSSLYLKMLKRQHIGRNCMERKRNKVCNDSIVFWKSSSSCFDK